MNLQVQRIESLCASLHLNGVAANYLALSQQAVVKESSYSDYLEECLKVEQQVRQLRSRSILLKMAGFPVFYVCYLF
jgi:hypothetical protein